MMRDSMIWAYPPADPGTAAAHLKLRLSMETDPSDLHKDLKARIPGIVVVDARKPESYEKGHIPGAINLPYAQMTAAGMGAFSKEDLYVCYCSGVACNASLKGAFNLASLGFKVKELVDGLHGWVDHGYPVATGKEPGRLG